MTAPLEPMDDEANTVSRLSQIVMVIAALMIVAVTWVVGAVGESEASGRAQEQTVPVTAAPGGPPPGV